MVASDQQDPVALLRIHLFRLWLGGSGGFFGRQPKGKRQRRSTKNRPVHGGIEAVSKLGQGGYYGDSKPSVFSRGSATLDGRVLVMGNAAQDAPDERQE